MERFIARFIATNYYYFLFISKKLIIIVGIGKVSITFTKYQVKNGNIFC